MMQFCKKNSSSNWSVGDDVPQLPMQLGSAVYV